MPSTFQSRLFLPLLLAAGIGSAHAQAIQWTRAASSNLPPHAVSTGGTPSGVVCRLASSGNLIPGELVAGNCTIVTTAAESRADSFEVLIGPNTLTWIQDSGRDPRSYPRGSSIPDGAVQAGQFNGQTAYVCRTNGHVGRLVGGICTVSVDGNVQTNAQWDVLANRTLKQGSGVGLAVGRDPSAVRSGPVPPGTPTPPSSTPVPPGTPNPPGSTPVPPGTPNPPGSTPVPPGTPNPPASTPVPPVTPPASTPVPPSTPQQPASSGR